MWVEVWGGASDLKLKRKDMNKILKGRIRSLYSAKTIVIGLLMTPTLTTRVTTFDRYFCVASSAPVCSAYSHALYSVRGSPVRVLCSIPVSTVCDLIVTHSSGG